MRGWCAECYFPIPAPLELLPAVLLKPIELDPEKLEPLDLLPLLELEDEPPEMLGPLPVQYNMPACPR